MTTQAEAGRGPGYQWKDPERVREFVDLTDRETVETAQIHAVLISLIPFGRDASIRVLDIGSGHGLLAGSVLDAFPNAQAIGLDLSEAMMEEGRKRMARFGDRFTYHLGEFSDGSLPADLPGTFDVAVSSRAIHHIRPAAKMRLFADIHLRLNDGGCFLDIDNMRPRDPLLRERYADIRDPVAAAARRERQRARGGGGGEHADPMDDQVLWLRQAGFRHVDCFWKKLDRSMIGGYKAAAPSRDG